MSFHIIFWTYSEEKSDLFTMKSNLMVLDYYIEADTEAIGLSRVHKHYSKCNLPSQYICHGFVGKHILTTKLMGCLGSLPTR